MFEFIYFFRKFILCDFEDFPLCENNGDRNKNFFNVMHSIVHKKAKVPTKEELVKLGRFVNAEHANKNFPAMNKVLKTQLMNHYKYLRRHLFKHFGIDGGCVLFGSNGAICFQILSL